MGKVSYDWLDDAYLDDTELFGSSRHDLRLAEETFSPDMPDDALLRLYVFVKNNEDNPLWDVIQAKITDQILSRMKGGPLVRLLKHARGFDPEDHDKLLAAIRANELTNDDMLLYYYISTGTAEASIYTPEDGRHKRAWRAILPLIRQRIIFRMQDGARAIRQLE